MLRNNLMLPTEALDIPEAIDFDGTNDYLSRSSDLMGNADGKTFTFSAWVWVNEDGSEFGIYNAVISETNNQSGLSLSSLSGGVAVFARNASNASVLTGYTSNTSWAYKTWNHVLVSVDLSNTSNRSIYINDILQTVTWTSYVNNNFDCTRPEHKVAVRGDGAKYKERLAHVFLDYTYRDLSVEANRRLFITADRKPAANQHG